MDLSTVLQALLGGALIGTAAALFFVLNGRIAGISGICAGLVEMGHRGQYLWRLSFVVGLLAGGVLMEHLLPDVFIVGIRRSPTALIIAGLLVGVGTRIGNGCTSGHGVCGLGRLSKRSLIATLVFTLSGIAMATWVDRFFEGTI